MGEDEQKHELIEALRRVRDQARAQTLPQAELPGLDVKAIASPLEPLRPGAPAPAPVSPDRATLNARWDVSTALREPPAGPLGRALSPVRGLLQRLVRFALGPVVERQTELNSAQVRFDNELVAYLDARLDRISLHYDHVLGLHGKRMAEVDERHMILQQELVRHVHELVKRIEFVFENAEQNHLYLDGALRELREELKALALKLPR